MNTRTISFRFDPGNPGQYFACCGLLELAGRVWPSAVGWFDGPRFFLYEPMLDERALGSIFDRLRSTRLITDSTRNSGALNPLLVESFGILLDWWVDSSGNKTKLKMWAGQQTALGIARMLQEATTAADGPGEDLFERASPLTGRFGFDPRAAWNALDVGFSPNEQNMEVASYPAVELLAAIGIQGFRPVERNGSFVYYLWSIALPVRVARAASAGVLPVARDAYQFEIVRRGSYKAFSTSTRTGG